MHQDLYAWNFYSRFSGRFHQLFQSTGQPMKASVLSMLRQLILLIPFILIMPLFLGLDGILIAGPMADIISALIVAVFAVHELKKLSKSCATNPAI